MAVPPTVPTSFGPQQSFVRRQHAQIDLGGAFAFVCYAAFVIALLATIGVFVYQKILEKELVGKEAKLAEAQAKIDEPTVKSVIALRDRLREGEKLLNQHIAFSRLFDAIEDVTLQNVNLASLSVQVDADHSGKLLLTGTAKNFNALAAESEAFADNPEFKDAIFSGITLITGGKVTFSLSAILDPSLYVYRVDSGAAPRTSSSTPEIETP